MVDSHKIHVVYCYDVEVHNIIILNTINYTVGPNLKLLRLMQSAGMISPCP